MPDKVSVIIPTRGRSKCLQRLIASLCEDVRKHAAELIVVDDAVDKELQAPSNVRLLRSGGKGPAQARNVGVRSATGSLLLFVDDDSVAPEGYLGRVLDTARRLGPGHAFAGPQRCLPGATPAAQASGALLDWFTAATGECEREFLPSNGLAVFRCDYEHSGGFNTRFPGAAGEDREFSSRLRRAGVTLRLEESLALFHEFPPTVSKFFEQQWRYGRGARQYARIAAGCLKPRTAHSYWTLLREATRRGGFTTASLCAAAQCFVLAGFLWELSTHRES
ncbi:MAG TPA: glycosyltransferase [Bryobacteraceae bacterium]|nr:glycosyltransferase [Bryobacteraceae bacterium]